jgi:hypothetical protein
MRVKEKKCLQDKIKAALLFHDQRRKLIPLFEPTLVINTNQIRCEYRAQIRHMLSYQGEKATVVCVSQVNKMTRSYTTQYSVMCSGVLLPQVFICLQEM